MATVALEQMDPPSARRDPDTLYEVVDGRIVEKLMGAFECWVAAVIFGELDRYVEQNPGGRVVPEMIFDLRPHLNRERRPDVAFVSFERWAADRGMPKSPSWPVIPDLAVEVVSPTNTADHVNDKIEEYFQVGVRLVWVVYPSHTKVYVYTSPEDVRILTPKRELDGGEVVPGFRVSVARLFNKVGRPE